MEPYTMPIQFPPYPKHLMSFHEVIEQPNKTLVGNDPSFVHGLYLKQQNLNIP